MRILRKNKRDAIYKNQMYFISFLIKKNPDKYEKTTNEENIFTEIVNVENYCDNIFLMKPII